MTPHQGKLNDLEGRASGFDDSWHTFNAHSDPNLFPVVIRVFGWKVFRFGLVLIVTSLAGCGKAVALKDIGAPPSLGVGARDLGASFKLPPIRDGAGTELAAQEGNFQMGKRASELKLNSRSATEAWKTADAALQAARSRLIFAFPAKYRTFNGSRASELNAILGDPAISAVRVTSARIEADETILLKRAKFYLDLGTAELRGSEKGPRFLLRVEHAPGAVVTGGAFIGGQWGTVVTESQDVTLLGSRYERLQRGGVVFTNASGAVLARTFLTRIGGAPVLIHGDTAGSVMLDNEIVGNLGPSNWNAGIVLSDRNGPVADDPQSILNPDMYGAREQPIMERRHVPRFTVLAGNRIALNASSGIYSDGGVQSAIFDNTIEGNSKEGLCLDNGSASNVVAFNLIRDNGKRWGSTDEQLELDFVEGFKRLPDGSSPAKTPGVSLDNALYNIVYGNHLERNYGGGVKMVRTAFFNVVGLNTIVDNNEGASERFHFFGIELGAAIPDVPVSDLDFTPCRGNIIFGNSIRGSHYAGIFLSKGSTANDVFDNSIFGATNWSMEQVVPQPNSSVNNLTNIPSRNIGSGMDAELLKLTKGQFD